MNAGQLLSMLAIAVILGSTVAVSAADPGDNTIAAEERWNNTDIVENVYPDYTECTARDNFYAYVFNDMYASLGGLADETAAKNKFNLATTTYKYYKATDTDVNDVLNYPNKLSGPDAGVVSLYRSLLLDAGSDGDMELVAEYVKEVREMDTAEEFADYVRTGGSGNFRGAFTGKAVWNSPVTGHTTLLVTEGPVSDVMVSGSQTEEEVRTNLENYRNLLDAYFASEPRVAQTYYEDLVYASGYLEDASAGGYYGRSYSGITGMFSNYPMDEDLAIYKEAGLDDYTITDIGYLNALDRICSEDAYRYSRAIAMYAVLSDCAYRMGQEYVRLITGGDLGGSGIVYDHDHSGPVYGMLVGKYYTQLHGEPYREVMEGSVAAVIEAAKDYFCSLGWICDDTKGRIVEKISKLTVRVCGPQGEQWDQYDYSDASDAACLVDLTSQMRAINESIQLEQCVQERGEFWPYQLMPQQYNAFYSAMDNSINIVAGYVVPRIEAATSPEVLCATTFVTIGHELTHGFDVNGSEYTPEGKHNPGWLFTDSELREFKERICDLIDFMDGIAVADGRAHSGTLTNGELTADMGGIAIVLGMAKDVDGFDYDLFFRTFANMFALMYDHDGYVDTVMTDPHPSGMFRTNIDLMQFREFLDCYGIVEGDGMYLLESVNPWRVS